MSTSSTPLKRAPLRRRCCTFEVLATVTANAAALAVALRPAEGHLEKS